jgi:hypothetical protein
MFLAMKRFSNVKNPDIVTKKIETDLVPKIRDFPGFIAYYAVKFDNGDYGSIGVFETKENIDSALKQTQDWPKNNLPDVPNDPELIRGEVLFSAAGKTIARSA